MREVNKMWLIALTTPGWHLPSSPARTHGARPCVRARPCVCSGVRASALDRFKLSVDLGEGDGSCAVEFQPYFSSSQLMTFRYPVPFTLEAEPMGGVIKVTDSGEGLIEGDVLRAFSTLEVRYDSATGERRYCKGGVRGVAVDEAERKRSWKRCNPAKGLLRLINPETKPERCLFVFEGQPYQQVVDALVANSPDKTGEIVMVFERPLPS